MRYIFCSFMFDDVENDIKKSKSPNSVSGHKFQENMLKGLVDNNCNLSVINVPRIRRYPDYKKVVIKKSIRNDYIPMKSIGFINLFGINYITQIIGTFFALKKEIGKGNKEKTVLLLYNTYLAPILAIRLVKKIYPSVIICDVIGDIYGKYGLKTENTIHGKLLNVVHNLMDSMASECDVFALATENVAVALNVLEKPHVVLEGMYEITEPIKVVPSKDYKVIFYAGALLEEYGILHLLNAFSLIDDPTYKLYIAGSGEMVGEIKNRMLKDPRIEYLGFLSPNEVEKYQSISTVLVNPRTSEHEYVKYSFASKNLEYLASGVPYIAHNLSCNPAEYSDYIIYPEGETDIDLARKIQEVCQLPYEERIFIGKRNIEFIKMFKNPQKQMKKLIDIIETSFGECIWN